MAWFRRRSASLGARWSLFALLLGSLVGTVPAPSVAGQVPPGLYAEATGHVLSEPFLSYWTARDGMTLFGLPVTEAVQHEQTRVQYFDYAALTTSSTTTTTASTITSPVTRIALGRELLRLAHEPGRLVEGRRTVNARETIAFRRQSLPAPAPTTARRATSVRPAAVDDVAFTVGVRFRDFYGLQGGLTRFGFPLSLPYRSAGMTIQWFEYARLETRPEVDSLVRVSPVGLELARARGVSTAKVFRGRVPFLDRRSVSPTGEAAAYWDPRVAFVPTRIEIPAIAVDAEIERAKIVNGKMESPQNAWKVAWYPSLALPGDDDNAVMAAHKDFWGIGPTVFANLYLLQLGDVIEVHGAAGVLASYRVTRTWEVGAGSNPLPVVGDTGMEALTLFTCSGSFDGFDYDKRFVVRAERVSLSDMV